ncbi:MAG: phosphoglucosamine mutase [Actinobacteria bacterium]|nr:phosphoglucosamine mutase [Actinomycetota bacterium]
MKKYFGTDGIRGKANIDLTPELALCLGRAVVRALKSHECRVVVGRDTRISGGMLESAVVAGLLSENATVFIADVLPTPGIAYLTEKLKANAGIVISASHNPFEDNGIKVFGPGGVKLPDDAEKVIEAQFGNVSTGGVENAVGELVYESDAEELYIEYLMKCAGTDLDGLNIALDCANGAAYRVCPEAFRRLGADVDAIGIDPDGRNINLDCGSTHLEALVEKVRGDGFDFGFALDGDADRCICVDEKGNVFDGDFIMAIIAGHLKKNGLLDPPVVVSTVMSNFGFFKAMEEMGISTLKTPVGDRYVMEQMISSGSIMGGEQSGHIIFREYASTGDGTLTALILSRIVKESGEGLSTLAGSMKKFPQVLINVRSGSGRRLQAEMEVWDTIRKFEDELGDKGRVLVRSSGTEAVERVMVEADNEARARSIANAIADAISIELDSK